MSDRNGLRDAISIDVCDIAELSSVRIETTDRKGCRLRVAGFSRYAALRNLSYCWVQVGRRTKCKDRRV